MTHRVLIVDDQELLRRGLRLLLESTGAVDIVGEARDGAEALAAIEHSRPDVVLADAVMPGMDAIGLLRRATVRHPGLPVVVLTTFDDDALVHTALDAGAAGFLLKDTSPERIVEAIDQARAGNLVLDPRVTSAALRRPQPAPIDPLTDGERRVAELVADGRSNAEIAAALHLAPGTVKNYVSIAMRKLGAEDRTQLALRIDRARR